MQEGAKKKPGKNERSAKTRCTISGSKLRCEGEEQRETKERGYIEYIQFVKERMEERRSSVKGKTRQKGGKM